MSLKNANQLLARLGHWKLHSPSSGLFQEWGWRASGGIQEMSRSPMQAAIPGAWLEASPPQNLQGKHSLSPEGNAQPARVPSPSPGACGPPLLFGNS